MISSSKFIKSYMIRSKRLISSNILFFNNRIPTDKMRDTKFGLILIILLLHKPLLYADIRLPAVISDNMVIQQNTNVPIWGWADPGEKIHIKASWLLVETAITANDKGEWMVKLKSPVAGGPHKITLTGKNEIVLDNVLSGEVWFASGQSNMAMALKKCDNAEMEVAAANYPEIRLFHIERISATEPQSDCEGTWKETTPESAKDFSGVAYFFGRMLHEQLNVPIGLISGSKGGSPVESWMAEEVLKSDPDFSAIFEMWNKWEEDYPEAEKEYQKELESWQIEKEQALSSAKGIPEKPAMPKAVHRIRRPHKRPGNNYNGMVAPVIPYAVKGVIWYQGENNVYRPAQYQKLFQTLITSWREEWQEGNFPFYFVQIAPYRYEDDLINPSLLREAQMMALSLPNTGMAVTTDLGNVEDIHPKNKQDVGKRLALWALAKTYDYKDLVYSGPLYKYMKIEDDKIRLYFDHIGSGLVCKGDSLIDFEIAGSDQEFIRARANIDGNTVVVLSDQIKKPIAVRFGWSITSEPNLFNEQELPAAPFRTDVWNSIQK